MDTGIKFILFICEKVEDEVIFELFAMKDFEELRNHQDILSEVV